MINERNQNNAICELNKRCFSYPECKKLKDCLRQLPQDSVFSLRGLTIKRQAELYFEGIESFEDVRNSGIDLKPKTERQLNFELDNRPMYIDKDAISSIIGTYHYPLTFFALDAQILLSPNGERLSKRRVLKGYSVRIKQNYNDTECDYKEKSYQAEGCNFCEREIVQRLIADVPGDGTVVVYSGTGSLATFRLDELAEAYADLAPQLNGIKDRAVDFLDIFKEGYLYKKEMRGSYNLGHVYFALRSEPDERFKGQIAKSSADTLALSLVYDIVNDLVK